MGLHLAGVNPHKKSRLKSALKASPNTLAAGVTGKAEPFHTLNGYCWGQAEIWNWVEILFDCWNAQHNVLSGWTAG